jgi:dehydrogenase/reductase SDR family protein 12
MRMIGLIKQGIVSTQFFLYGKKHFTKTGYLRHASEYDDPVQSTTFVDPNDPTNNTDGVDLSGKTFLISGANQGIGREIATYAASKRATVYMLCRNKERADIARNEIAELTRNDNVLVLLGDVSEPSHVARVVSEFAIRETKLDCLVCNAGALFNDRRVNGDGNEVTLMSHLVCGSYQLTKLLLPSLNNSSDGRVIYVSSGGMYNTKFPQWDVAASSGDHVSGYDGNMAYSYAKRGQVLLAERFAREYPNIAFLSCHPGWVRTVGVEDAFGDKAKILEPLRNGWEGSEGICWLMATARTNLISGEFYLDRKPQRKHIAGAFFTEGVYTKNTDEEVDTMMKKLEETCGV